MGTLITIDEMDYLAGQSEDNMNMILSGMAALLDENNEKAEMLASQTWFQRMGRTISGKNKMTLAEIQQNQDKINLYVTQAMSELFERNCISQQIMMSLGTRLNELYADHIQLKQMLGAFADKLNQKIISIDNFHMLETEIEQGVYDGLMPVAAICKVLSQLDIRTLNDGRKLEILERSLRGHGILSEEPVGILECLMGMLDTPGSDIWPIYMELECLKGNFIADILKQTIEQYHFLSETAKRMKRKERIASSIIQQNQLDDSAELAPGDIYREFLDAKIMAAPQIALQEAGCSSAGEASEGLGDAVGAFLKCDKDGIANLLEPLAEQEDGLALYLMSFLDYLQEDTRSKDFLERSHIAGNPMGSIRYAKRCKNKAKGDVIVRDNIDKLKDMSARGDMFAQYEYALLFSEKSKFKIQQDGEVDVRGLLQASAEQGFWVAAYQLAYRCRYGIDGEADYEKAFKLYSKLNQLKVLSGICKLADFYMKGIFVEENKEKAVELYKKAIECGEMEAKCYQNGWGVCKNRKKAEELYEDYLGLQSGDDLVLLISGFMFNVEGTNALIESIKSIQLEYQMSLAAHQMIVLKLEDEKRTEAMMYLVLAVLLGDSYALYEYSKFFTVENSFEYCEAYPESIYIEDDFCILAEELPYNLEIAQICLEKAKEFTDYSDLIEKIEWLEVKISAKAAKDIFTEGKNLLKGIFR